MRPAPIRIQYHTPERHPSLRADVAALFGRYLPRHGILAPLVTMGDAQADAPQWPGGTDQVIRPGRRRSLNTLRLLGHRLRCLFASSWRNVDAVMIRDMPSFAAVAWLACRFRRRPFLYWMSFPMVDAFRVLGDAGPRRIGWLRWTYARVRQFAGSILLYGVSVRRADHVFVQSDAMRTSLLELGCHPERVTAVPMGVDLEEFDLCRIEPRRDPRIEGRTAVVYTGTLSSTRRLDILLEGFALALSRQPDAVLVMVGREDVPGEAAALRSEAARLGIEPAVIWTGWLPRAQAASWVRAATVGVSLVPRGPLFDVSSPTKLCEYMALGVPGLVNDIPDQAWVAEQSQAARVVSMEPSSIATALVGMLSDPLALAEMSRRGPAFIEAERSYSVIASRLANVLRRVLSQPEERGGIARSAQDPAP